MILRPVGTSWVFCTFFFLFVSPALAEDSSSGNSRARLGIANAVPAESIGLAGLRDRIESLGGSMVVRSSHAGTRLTMSVGTEDIEPL